MFKIGDMVQHQTTGKVGRVVGYGCQISDRTYFLTLKVKPLKRFYFRPIEDLMSVWHFLRVDSPTLHYQSLAKTR